MGHAAEDALAEEEAILFHAADGIEIGKKDFTSIEYPAVETSEVLDFEKLKDLFCLRLDLGDDVEIEAWWSMVEGVASGEVFFSVVEDLIVEIGGFDFGRDEGDRRVVGILEDDNGEFFAYTEGFEEGLVGWVLGEEGLSFFEGFIWGVNNVDANRGPSSGGFHNGFA